MIGKTYNRILVSGFFIVCGLFAFASENIVAQKKDPGKLVWSTKLSGDDSKYIELNLDLSAISESGYYVSSNIRCKVGVYGNKGKFLGERTITVNSSELDYGTTNKRYGLHGFNAVVKSVKSIEADYQVLPRFLVLNLPESSDDDKSRTIDNFIKILNRNPSGSGYIILYGSADFIKESQDEFKNLFLDKEFDLSRVTFVRGDDAENTATLWYVPAGALPPMP